MSKSKELHQIGQSIWFDNIDRQLINNNWFDTQIKNGLFYGVTSNPSIFKKSITQSNEYTEDIQSMSWSGLSAREIYELLAIKDIKDVSDLLYPAYETNCSDEFLIFKFSILCSSENSEPNSGIITFLFS